MSDSMFTHIQSSHNVHNKDGTAVDERRLDRGLVMSSFGSNLIEFFWHASAGREATITARSGYATRLCMKMSEHLPAAYDDTIRDSMNNKVLEPECETYNELKSRMCDERTLFRHYSDSIPTEIIQQRS